ncbi:hypothetical protein Mapa_016421 [Marchantia paleacea]|nr:hypothetical protein Mapa_016421 [Marchantia paleacea]
MMQPLVALAGSTCPPAVRSATGACTGEPTGKFGVTSAAPRISTSSRNGFVKWNSRGTERGTIGGSHTLFASISGRRSLKVKASAATEDEVTVDLLTLEAGAESPDTAPASEAKLESVAEEESVAPIEDTRPKANVKFVLQKECHFGQQFNVVGEISELGEWDPAHAVAMEWSEGHVWTAEVGIPVGLTVKYKFVMTGKRLELEWQPGEDKCFETKDETDITVTEVWADPEPVEAGVDGETEIAGEFAEPASSANGVATASVDSDLQEAVAAVVSVAEAATDEETANEERVEDKGTEILSGNEAEQVGGAEVPEIPVVDAALATAVAEVSGEVEDAAAAEI